MTPHDTTAGATPTPAGAAGHSASGRQRGVTLMELMIVVAIIGLIAAIAYPSYQNQVDKTRRTDGHAALMESAQRIERCHTLTNSYSACEDQLLAESGEGHYTLVIQSTANSFQLTATPVGVQERDSCGALSLTHTGQRSAAEGNVEDCW